VWVEGASIREEVGTYSKILRMCWQQGEDVRNWNTMRLMMRRGRGGTWKLWGRAGRLGW